MMIEFLRICVGRENNLANLNSTEFDKPYLKCFSDVFKATDRKSKYPRQSGSAANLNRYLSVASWRKITTSAR